MAESLKSKTVKGIIWSTFEKFSLMFSRFFIGIILARLLTPTDFGLVAIIYVFLAILDIFVDSGFANALVRKQNCEDIDYSTVFYINLLIAVVGYVLMFFASPYIADFYNNSQLDIMTKIVSLNLIINAISIVNRTKLVKVVDFKTQSKISLISIVFSGAVGIYMAYSNYGVWSLVAYSLIDSIARTILFFLFVKWFPKLEFSYKSFKELFSFGSKLLLTSVQHRIYLNIYTLILGKILSSKTVGLFARADQLAQFPATTLESIVTRVSYPILCSIQDDNERLEYVYREYIKLTSFIVFPLMFGLAAIAKPFIILILTDKWIDSVVILQILCFAYIWTHMNCINLNLLYVKGRSDLVYKLDILKKIIGISCLILCINYGLVPICFSRVIYGFSAIVINTYYTKKIIGLGFIKQISDVIQSVVMAGLMSVTVLYSYPYFGDSPLWQTVGGIFVGIVSYTVMSLITKNSELKKLFYLISERWNKDDGK